MQKPKKGRKVALVAGLALVVLSVAMVWTYWKEIRFFLKFERLEKNAQGYPEYRHRETGIVFVGLPGGTFEMGSPESESGRMEWEGPVHKVSLSPFLIAKYEVSQAEWKKVMGNRRSRFEGDTLPVGNVFWEDCQEFCTKAGLSLPTEAEWEYACRAGTSGAYAGTGKLDDMGWSKENSGGPPHPVGEKLPNDFGLHDMHGSVLEWCEDWFQEDFYQESTGVIDPLCENSGSGSRVVRGGSWYDPARVCRSAGRGRIPPSSRIEALGFRPTRSPP
ncbi:MAG: formylglycine-generating enzyme family protein [Planctomycetota bacterium]|nr:formylglycine-generating enzyme family protein [Planctomycetota bacterium]